MRFLLLAPLILYGLIGYSQKNLEHEWQIGSIELKNDSILEGYISYLPFINDNTLFFKEDITQLTTQKFNSSLGVNFSILDGNRVRLFHTFLKSHPDVDGLSPYSFYEIHYKNDEFALVSRRYLRKYEPHEINYEEPAMPPYAYSLRAEDIRDLREMASIEMVTEYYIITPNSVSLKPIDRKGNLPAAFKTNAKNYNTKNELLKFFGSLSTPMKKYIKSEKLKLKKLEDVIQALEHYSMLKNRQ